MDEGEGVSDENKFKFIRCGGCRIMSENREILDKMMGRIPPIDREYLDHREEERSLMLESNER